jgi:L-fucose isomerase
MDKHIEKRRLRGAIPKIGIRPTIDGREKGVRESLEDQTMRMANSVANFLSSKLTHPNGMKVECVISDSTIGGVTQAEECAQKFRKLFGDLMVLNAQAQYILQQF